ncbi:hypothetical protein HD806DRAFT_530742 [Xylariaceae sp. AK1471]|nr:hypothetical protein HD806DRAFT_530742 [Xylariaceae sp. AK1471]
MSFAFTFGSLGDIIALAQIAIQLGRALGVVGSKAASSARQYQDLRKELDIFIRVLGQVIETYQQHETSPFLKSLDTTTKAIVDDCGSLIQEVFDELIPRYDENLHSEGPESKIRSVVKKIEWSFREQGRLQKLREKLHESTQLLNLMIGIATQASARVDNCTLRERVADVKELVLTLEQESSTILSLFHGQKRATSPHDERLESIGNKLNAEDHQFQAITSITREGFSDIKSMLAEITTSSTSQQISAADSWNLRSLDLTRGMPIILEDALGSIVELPMGFVSGWQDLYVLIECRFRRRKGYSLALQRQYTLENDHSGEDLDINKPLMSSLWRGMKINMAMVFINADVLSGSCPRCQTRIDAQEGTTLQCPIIDCGMLFKLEKFVFFQSRADEDHDPTFSSMSMEEKPERPAIRSVPVKPSDFHRVRLRLDCTPRIISPKAEPFDAVFPRLTQEALRLIGPGPLRRAACKSSVESLMNNTCIPRLVRTIANLVIPRFPVRDIPDFQPEFYPISIERFLEDDQDYLWYGCPLTPLHAVTAFDLYKMVPMPIYAHKHE